MRALRVARLAVGIVLVAFAALAALLAAVMPPSPGDVLARLDAPEGAVVTEPMRVARQDGLRPGYAGVSFDVPAASPARLAEHFAAQCGRIGLSPVRPPGSGAGSSRTGTASPENGTGPPERAAMRVCEGRADDRLMDVTVFALCGAETCAVTLELLRM